MWPGVFGSLHDYSFWQLAREGWQCLVVYYAFVSVVLAWPDLPLYRRLVLGGRSRLKFTLLLTVLLTPGTVSDFSMIAFAGPAVAG
jgi:hypothetical protein